MLRKRTLLLALFFVSHTFLWAGSSDAHITGITSSKRTEVALLVGDVTGLIREVSLKIDGQSYTFTPAHSTVIRDEVNQVYVLIAEHENYHFKMWMIPGSEKVLSKTSGSLKTTFSAIIEATDPRQNKKWSITPRITIGCRLKYSI